MTNMQLKFLQYKSSIKKSDQSKKVFFLIQATEKDQHQVI